MSCYQPKRVIQKKGSKLLPSLHPDKKLKFLKSYGDSVYFGDKYLGEWNDLQNTYNEVYDYLEVPCGKCLGCKLDYAKDWTVRNLLEAKNWSDNYFVTLTYDDDHLPLFIQDQKNDDVVDEFCFYSLVPEDLTKFMKSLRQKYKQLYNHDNIRFFACGEYGTNSGRPHFHILLYNCPIYDLKYYKGQGDSTYYTSKLIESIWKKGYCVIGEVNSNSAAYVSRYVLKKVHEDCDFNGLPVEKEFLRMSRKPGIGQSYFENNVDKIYKYDEIYLADKFGSTFSVKPPSYFDKLFQDLHPDEMLFIKESRLKRAKDTQFARMLNTDIKRYEDYLKVCEKNKLSEISSLQRGL